MLKTEVSWADYYADRVCNNMYHIKFTYKYDVFLRKIASEIKHNSIVVEDGCGIGSVAKALHTYPLKEHTYIMLDIDMGQLRQTQQNLRDIKAEYCVNYGNILSYDRIPSDMVVTHGVLEHFADDNLYTILNSQANKAPIAIHYVPTNGYDSPSFGDERLMPYEWWLDLFKEHYEEVEYTLFNDSKDLCIIARRSLI